MAPPPWSHLAATDSAAGLREFTPLAGDAANAEDDVAAGSATSPLRPSTTSTRARSTTGPGPDMSPLRPDELSPGGDVEVAVPGASPAAASTAEVLATPVTTPAAPAYVGGSSPAAGATDAAGDADPVVDHDGSSPSFPAPPPAAVVAPRPLPQPVIRSAATAAVLAAISSNPSPALSSRAPSATASAAPALEPVHAAAPEPALPPFPSSTVPLGADALHDWFGTAAFLHAHGFDSTVAQALRQYSGADLMSLEAEDAVEFAGPREGMRLLEVIDRYR